MIKSRQIPLIEAGPERELMVCFLERVKRIKGLTTALVQKAGVKNQWLKPDEPRNFPVKRFLRIILHTTYTLDREECKQRADIFIDYVYDHILPNYADHQAGKRKQRPPSIRCLYRHRYRRSKNNLITHQIIFVMEHPTTIRDILYGICNTRDADLPLFQRELKAYILRRGILHQREPHDSPQKPP